MSPAARLDPEQARAAVLEAADRLFYQRGIALVGMHDVRDAAGVSLRRLYLLYPSKRDLVTGWLEDRHVRWMAWFTDAVRRCSATGTDPLLATFDALDEWVASPGYRGCAFLNAIAETSEIDQRHRAIVASHKRELIAHLAELATGHRTELPGWTAAAVGVLLDGAIVQTAVFGSAEPIDAARRAAIRLVS